MDEAVSITSFKTADDYFGIETMKIQHILENVPATAIPLTEDYFRGVINYHGNMIPVIDFRLLIGLEADEEQEESSIIIFSPDDAVDTQLGIKVDQVEEVFSAEGDKKTDGVLIEVNKNVQPAFISTITHGDKYIYIIGVDELTKIIEQR